MADDTPAQSKPKSAFGLNPTDDLHDLRMSEKAMPLLEHVKAFIKETVNPTVFSSLATRAGGEVVGADQF